MAAVDKLHKLYSSTTAPVVWARSTGLEIINELDTVKTALMLSAGAESRVQRTLPQNLSYLAAGAFSGMVHAAEAAKMTASAAQGLVGVGLQEMGKAIAGRR
jgi:ubiquinone biosynthesis monooxygenase Coq6